MIMFIKLVKKQLDKMSETEKDKWILTQAKLLEESKQEGFLMSLSGEKKIIYMPSQKEIEELCDKVEIGEIYLEYETHYFEFDDNGRYMDDWKVWHNDPLKAFSLLNRIFMGCNDLLIYWRNLDIMRKKLLIYTINMGETTNMFPIWKHIWKRKTKHM